MTIAQRVAAERRAERERIRQLNTKIAPGPDGEDHGMDLGPAALARPSTIQRVGGRLRGAGQKEATPTYARMIDATTIFERMNLSAQLSDRQAQAGHRILMLRHAAGILPRVTAKYVIVQPPPPDDDDDPETAADVDPLFPDGYDARTYHRWALRQLAPPVAAMIDRACEWTPENPVGRPETRFLATFQEGLDKLADIFSIKKR
jgi:hypothetical protein